MKLIFDLLIGFLILASLSNCKTASVQTGHHAVESEKFTISQLYVASKRQTCMGETEQLCWLVRNNPKEEWTLFYENIKGFAYEEGYEYLIEVKITSLASQPADRSMYDYELVKVISKEKKNSELK